MRANICFVAIASALLAMFGCGGGEGDWSGAGMAAGTFDPNKSITDNNPAVNTGQTTPLTPDQDTNGNSIPDDLEDLNGDGLPDGMTKDTNRNGIPDFQEDADLATPGIQTPDAGLPPSALPGGGPGGLGQIMQMMGMAMGAIMMPMQMLFMFNMMKSMFVKPGGGAGGGAAGGIPGMSSSVCIAPQGAMSATPGSISGGNAVETDFGRLAGTSYKSSVEGSVLTFGAGGTYEWRNRTASVLRGTYAIGGPKPGVPLTARFLMLTPNAPKGVGCIEMFTMTVTSDGPCDPDEAALAKTSFPLPPDQNGTPGMACTLALPLPPVERAIATTTHPGAELVDVVPIPPPMVDPVQVLNMLNNTDPTYGNPAKRAKTIRFYPENPDPTCADIAGARWNTTTAKQALSSLRGTIPSFVLEGQPIRKAPGKDFKTAEVPQAYEAVMTRTSPVPQKLPTCNSSEAKSRFDDGRPFGDLAR